MNVLVPDFGEILSLLSRLSISLFLKRNEIARMSANAAKLENKIDPAGDIAAHTEAAYQPRVKVQWYRSSFFAAIILGLCNFCAPGLWGAMNSVGAGGEETPWLANSANAETFSLMVLTAFLTSTITRYIGVRWTLFFGAAGYAPCESSTSLVAQETRTNPFHVSRCPPDAAGLYLNNVSLFPQYLVLASHIYCTLMSLNRFTDRWGRVDAAVRRGAVRHLGRDLLGHRSRRRVVLLRA